jgi:hypothetical protein
MFVRPPQLTPPPSKIEPHRQEQEADRAAKNEKPNHE